MKSGHRSDLCDLAFSDCSEQSDSALVPSMKNEMLPFPFFALCLYSSNTIGNNSHKHRKLQYLFYCGKPGLL